MGLTSPFRYNHHRYMAAAAAAAAAAATAATTPTNGKKILGYIPIQYSPSTYGAIIVIIERKFSQCTKAVEGFRVTQFNTI